MDARRRPDYAPGFGVLRLVRYTWLLSDAKYLTKCKLDKEMRIVFTTLILACLSGAVASAADGKAGQVAYDTSCKTCHGPDGTANPVIAKMMKVDMKDLKSAEVQALSDDNIKKIISGGKGKMRPVNAVSGPDVDNVVAYVRTLKK